MTSAERLIGASTRVGRQPAATGRERLIDHEWVQRREVNPMLVVRPQACPDAQERSARDAIGRDQCRVGCRLGEPRDARTHVSVLIERDVLQQTIPLRSDVSSNSCLLQVPQRRLRRTRRSTDSRQVATTQRV